MSDHARNAGTGTAAVVFDMDGVVTDTAEAHFAAWKSVFDEFLNRQNGGEPFGRRDYLAHVDGVPRYDGVRRFLESRGIELPEGDTGDKGFDSVFGLGNLKNERFGTWLDENRVPVFEAAADLIDGLRATGLKLGIFSASRNAKRVLKSAGLDDVFDATVDGTEAQDRGLAPKPAADQLVETARRLGCDPAEAAVVEDAVSGVTAGAAGRFGLVIGVNRQQEDAGAQRYALRSNGADLVTRDLRRLLLPGGGGLRTLDRLPLVWDRLGEVRERLEGRHLSVFLDYDGTLSPIVADYRKASSPDETRDAVSRLAGRCAVAVISGRDLSDVRERMGLGRVFYAGSHGFDIAGPGGFEERPEEADGLIGPIARAGSELQEALAGTAGARVECKTFSIAVHFRQAAPDDVQAIEDTVDDVVGRHEELRKSRGKKVFEVQPRADWDKGRAVEWLLAHTRLGEGGALPLYIGDDLTDEDAFGALSRSGLCIAVRGDGRATLADYALKDPADVRDFINWLTDHEAEET